MKVMTDKNIIDCILSRGVEEVIDAAHVRSLLYSGRKLRIKFGIDPTSPSIHLGRAIPLRKLRDFQKLGHKIILIIGDFTATIGDPSDKLSKRPMLSKKDVIRNMKTYNAQLGKIVDLKKTDILYNSAWLDTLTTRELTSLAESFSMQQILRRRNFQERLQKGEDISLRELFYPLFQGYDSVITKSDIEIGGFDQLFNLLAGRTIQKYYEKPEQDIIVTQMLEGTDGRKMSSSWGNVIALTDAPDAMFGKIMTLRDELITKYFTLCTDMPEDKIQEMEKSMREHTTNPRDTKLLLAETIVSLYFGRHEAQKTRDNFIRIFSQKKIPDNVPTLHAQINKKWIDYLVQSSLIESKSEAKRIINAGGVDFNGEKIELGDMITKGGILKIGKKHFTKIIVQ